MFTDMKEALAVEDLELTPLGSGQEAAAALVVAHNARDKEDLAYLLGALGLPCGEDDLTRLLPHLPTPDTPTTGVPMTNAFTATAVSMLRDGSSPDHVRSTLGLSDSELAEAAAHADQPAPAVPAPATDDSTSASQAAVPIADNTADTAGTTDVDGIGALLAWAEQHSAASIRNRAARVRTDLAELTERRTTDALQRQAEQRVAKAKAELEAAQAHLRTVKAGGPIAAGAQPTTPPAPAVASAPAPGKRSKQKLAEIRAWARANGHQVASRGTPAQAVLDAYDAAHPTTHRAEAS